MQFLGPWPKPVKPNLFGLFSGFQLSGSNWSWFLKHPAGAGTLTMRPLGMVKSVPGTG